MKLFQINVYANSGSHGKIAEQIGDVALSHGWESYIAYGRVANPSKSHLVKIGTMKEVYLHVLKARLTGKNGLGSVRATKRLIKQLDEIKPDLIHLHNIHGYYLNYAILFDYLNALDVPVVWTLHDCWAFTGHCAHFTYNKCEKWRTQCQHCQYYHDYPLSLVDNSSSNYSLKKKLFAANRNLTLIPVSNWLANLTKQSFLGHAYIKPIYNGVDLQVMYPRTSGRFEKFTLLAVASNWSSRKGLADYYQLMTMLCLDEYQLVLVGLTPKQISALPNGILGIRRTSSQDKLAELYSKSDIVLNLSYEETFGLTTVEGMACGTPGIVYNCTASPELITEETGIVVEPGDVAGVAKAIQTIRKKGKAFYSENCIARVERYFNKEKQYNEYFELYERLTKH